ncbi:MAG: acyl-CoA dehydrogenase C-terminal domain-containing protein, partial [Solirubrobacteraceae bacterium]|nr:acyl-CoA dehydrogenase C-terminal domain-containing protein [Solirubrobacteraceae bacterium]
HEGTHGIQAMDLLGRKAIMQGGKGLGVLAQTIMATIAEAGAQPESEAARYAVDLQAALDRLVQVTAQVWAPLDPELALANASYYLEAAGHIVVAWIWLRQLLVAGDQSGDFYEGKRQAARYFFAYELPRTGPQLDLLAKLDRTTLDMQDAWF